MTRFLDLGQSDTDFILILCICTPRLMPVWAICNNLNTLGLEERDDGPLGILAAFPSLCPFRFVTPELYHETR